jgi:hypothetical protein
MPLPDDGQVAEFDHDVAGNVVRAAAMAASSEALRIPTPFSSIRNPDGSLQNETQAEHDGRIVRTAVMHLLEQNLVVFPPDIEETLDDWIPAERVGRD